MHETAYAHQKQQDAYATGEIGINHSMPAKDTPDLELLGERLSFTCGQLQNALLVLHGIADRLYGSRPPQPEPPPSDGPAPDVPGHVHALNREAAALSWTAARIGEAINRFSHLT